MLSHQWVWRNFLFPTRTEWPALKGRCVSAVVPFCQSSMGFVSLALKIHFSARHDCLLPMPWFWGPFLLWGPFESQNTILEYYALSHFLACDKPWGYLGELDTSDCILCVAAAPQCLVLCLLWLQTSSVQRTYAFLLVFRKPFLLTTG